MKLFKNDLFKRSAVLLIAVLMMLTYCMPVFADDVDDDEELVEWFLSEDGSILSGNGKEYQYLSDTNFVGYLDVRNVYCFENDTWLGNVYSTSKDAEIVWIENYDSYYIYATTKGTQSLTRYVNGHDIIFRFEDKSGRQTDIVEKNLIYALDNDADASFTSTYEVDVSELRDAARYEVIAFDSTHTLARVYGAVYFIVGNCYYVNYSRLDVNYFDADGNFSYNPGPKGRTVVLTQIFSSNKSAVSTALSSLADVEINYTYEQEYLPFLPEELGVGAFWVSFSIIGFVAPIPFIVIGAVFANSKKRGRKKSWYILTAIGAAYLICAIALAILLAV